MPNITYPIYYFLVTQTFAKWIQSLLTPSFLKKHFHFFCTSMRASNKEGLLLLACELSSRADCWPAYSTSCVPLIKASASLITSTSAILSRRGPVWGRKEKNVVPNCITICKAENMQSEKTYSNVGKLLISPILGLH